MQVPFNPFQEINTENLISTQYPEDYVDNYEKREDVISEPVYVRDNSCFVAGGIRDNFRK